MPYKIVLYNPRAVFFTMPLALIAIGSRLDPTRFEVKIIDARIEREPLDVLLSEIDDALCLGITVLTGAPIRDALAITRAAKSKRPDLPVIWGGWHPSLFPEGCLGEPSVDFVVIGQGEDTFAEMVERLATHRAMEGVAGSAHRLSKDIVVEPPRPLRDINQFPAHNYALIDAENYFALKRSRQLDYISSQGCRFRCTFCADPYVYKRGWFGLEPKRIGEELEHLWTRYRFHDVGFQDETFFTSPQRVESIADEFLKRGLNFTWMATLRADQGFRLDERLLGYCKRAGLRRVMIGIESGSQRMLDWMKKDIKIEQIFDSADKCLRHGIAVIFNIIVGFPDEPPESVSESLRVAKALRAMSPDFQISIFYYKPYPGNEIADMLVRQGYPFPRTLEEWAEFDYVGSSGPWVTRARHDLIEGFKFYQRIGWSRPTPLRMPLQALARWRCERDLYTFPFEKKLIEWIRPSVQLS